MASPTWRTFTAQLTWFHHHWKRSSCKCPTSARHFGQRLPRKMIAEQWLRMSPPEPALVLRLEVLTVLGFQILGKNLEFPPPPHTTTTITHLIDLKHTPPTSCAGHFPRGNAASPPPTSCLEANDGWHRTSGRGSGNGHSVVDALLQIKTHNRSPAVCGQIDSLHIK